MYCKDASACISVVVVSSFGTSKLYRPSTVMVWNSPLNPQETMITLNRKRERKFFIKDAFDFVVRALHS
jgi:hypothetical protein